LRASKRGNDVIKHWYYYGRDFIGRIKTMKRTKRKLFKEQEARKILYKEIEEASGGMALKVIKENTRKAINVYKIFSEIGVERINRVKTFSYDSIGKLNKEEREEIVKNFN